MRTFAYKDESSDKFWNIELEGKRFRVAFGKAGSKGQVQVKEFPDAEAARKAHDKVVAEKLGKGYRETTPPSAPPLSALGKSLEAALVENPDDLAAHSAYADHLAEQGDPRGEFIQVQLAIEDEKRKPAERKRLREREAELLSKHGREWLGETAKFLLGKWAGEDKPWRWVFRRGWLDSVRLLPGPQEALEIFAAAPQIRLLRRLEVVYDMRYHNDFDEWVEGPAEALEIEDEEIYEMIEDGEVIAPLLKSPHLGNLRVLKIGFGDDDPDELRHSTMISAFSDCNAKSVLKLLARCPRLEELHLNAPIGNAKPLFASPALGGLRVLQYYFGTGRYSSMAQAYPLSALAGNAALASLRALRLHPGRDAEASPGEVRKLLASSNLPALESLQVHMSRHGDDLARAVADSGILRRLKHLDLAYGNMTDAGARLLADAAGLGGLESLIVSRNAMTSAGISALRKGGAKGLVADGQHGADDEGYTYEVDAE